MKTLFILNGARYGGERTYNAARADKVLVF